MEPLAYLRPKPSIRSEPIRAAHGKSGRERIAGQEAASAAYAPTFHPDALYRQPVGPTGRHVRLAGRSRATFI